MLDTIRNAVNSWIAKVLLAILLLCFVLLWGVPQLSRGTGNELLMSGKSKITSDTYRLALADQTIRVSMAYNNGRMLTPSEVQQIGLPQSVMSQMQQDVLLDEQLRKMKINISKDGIAKAIGKDAIFKEKNSFSKDMFVKFLQTIKASENDFIDYYAAKEKRIQLVLGAIAGIKAPDVFSSAVVAYNGETRDANYFAITPKEIGAIADPDQATLESWFGNHKQEFRAPEYRKVSLLQMTPNDLTKAQDISTDEAKAYYEQHLAQFAVPEKRIIEELRFPTREAADAAAQKLSKGLSFDDLVKSENKTLTDIRKGPVAKNELPSLVASDTFALKKDGVSAVINDLQGPVIVRAVDIIPSHQQPFETVENSIRQILAQKNAAKAMQENHDAIEDASFEGASLAELAKQYNLPLRELTIDQAGKTPGGQVINDLPQQAALLGMIAQLTEGANTNPLALPDGGYLWYRVESIIPARDQTLDEVKPAAINAWKAEQTQIRLDEKANELIKQLNAGKTLETLAKTLGVKIQTVHTIKRSTQDATLGKEGVQAIFGGPNGHSGAVKGTAATNRIIYKVTNVTEPLSTNAQSLGPELQQNINSAIGTDIRTEMLDEANKENPVKVNTDNYQRVINNIR